MSLQVLANLPSVERMAAAKDLHKLLNKFNKHAYRLVSYMVPVCFPATWFKSTQAFANSLFHSFLQLLVHFSEILLLAVRNMSRGAMCNPAGALDFIHMSWPHCGAPA